MMASGLADPKRQDKAEPLAILQDILMEADHLIGPLL